MDVTNCSTKKHPIYLLDQESARVYRHARLKQLLQSYLARIARLSHDLAEMAIVCSKDHSCVSQRYHLGAKLCADASMVSLEGKLPNLCCRRARECVPSPHPQCWTGEQMQRSLQTVRESLVEACQRIRFALDAPVRNTIVGAYSIAAVYDDPSFA